MNKSEYFNEFWRELAAQGWSHVILHSWQDYPERILSDIDYAVEGTDPESLLDWIASFSRSRGWRLVQAIEHEPKAIYAVCIQEQAPYDSIALDVVWDYRRLGHLFLDSAFLMSGRRQIDGKAFHVPSVGVEFCYILAKTAAKFKDFDEVKGRLGQLLAEDAEDCQVRVGKAFQDKLPDEAIMGDLVALQAWYEQMRYFEPIRSGRRLGGEEIQLYARRILYPTGVHFVIDDSISDEVVTSLKNVLEPLYRKVLVVKSQGMMHWWKIFLSKIRTRCVIEVKSSKGPIAPGAIRLQPESDVIHTAIDLLTDRVRSR